MRILVLLLLSCFFIACQPSKPSELEQYRTALKQNEATLEQSFERYLKEQTNATQPQENLSTTAVQNLKTSLQAIQISSETQVDSNTTASNPLSASQNGALLIQVRNYKETYDKIRALEEQYQANLVRESMETTKLHQGNTIELRTNQQQFANLMKEVESLGLIVRNKRTWKNSLNSDGALILQSALKTNQEAISRIDEQLANSKNLTDKLALEAARVDYQTGLDLAILKAEQLIEQPTESVLTITFYEQLASAQPAATTFNADFSSNLQLGWDHFKQFLLDAALVWPYLIIGLLFLITILLAVSSSKRKAQQFRLQMLQQQQRQVAAVVAAPAPTKD